ncbi:HNH endonuclease [Glutamicibacter nicotianae]|uniref:HNH endonuclease n=1 Tax=Glutamicibacter nicotianae TaxID=37929 RepID=UPI00167FD17C|nr:HNH endonuclease signature motif containing protein [Glutamicibacter nicotianae]
MPFFQVDDQLHVNPKAAALAEAALQDDLVGIAALGLWTMAGSVTQAALNDGLVSHVQLMKILLNSDAVDLLAARLVEVGLWHTAGHSCEQCPKVKEGHYLFHDWFQFGYDKGVEVRLARAKRKELNDPQIKAAVWARDAEDSKCSRGRCRYCGDMVFKKTSKGDKRPEMDHVDPTLAVGVRNIVLSCAQCNREKGRRTPEQAGKTLRPAPVRETASNPSSLTIAPSGPQNVAPETEAESPAVEQAPQSPAARFGLSLSKASAPAPAPSSLTIAPSGSQNVSPEPAVEADAFEVEEADMPAWAVEEDPDIPAAMTKFSTIDGQASAPSMVEEQEAIYGRAHTRARAGRAGQGWEGSGSGSALGQPEPPPDSPKPRRSRSRRRRGKKNPASGNQFSAALPDPGPVVSPHDAGEAPGVLAGGRFGSRYYGVKGQKVDEPNTSCEVHGLQLPCRKCQDLAERNP